MLEESVPSIFASVFGWFTPAVLFVLINIVIGTIAVASKSSHRHPSAAARDEQDGAAYPGRFLARSISRSPSVVIDRLRSFNLHRFCSGEIPPPLDVAADHGPAAGIAHEAPPAAPEAEDEFHQLLGRSQSDAQPTAGEMPPKLAVRMKKSASHKSAFAHFKEEEVEDAATAAVDPAQGDGGEEVDARADDFINRFRQQLKLQRLESILRYKEMINRGS